MDGYAGTILYVDLTTGTLEPRPYPEDLQQQYFGGRGLGVRLITDLVDPTTAPLGAADYAAMLSGVTGQTVTADQFMETGERIWNLQEGAPKGRVWERESMLDQYYAVRGWDSEGRPTPQTLQRLGIRG